MDNRDGVVSDILKLCDDYRALVPGHHSMSHYVLMDGDATAINLIGLPSETEVISWCKGKLYYSGDGLPGSLPSFLYKVVRPATGRYTFYVFRRSDVSWWETELIGSLFSDEQLHTDLRESGVVFSVVQGLDSGESLGRVVHSVELLFAF